MTARFVLLLGLLVPLAGALEIATDCSADSDCERLHYCEQTLQKCVHKSLFPMESYEIIGFFTIILFTILSSIAGGAVFQVTLTLVIYNFSPQESAAISSISLTVVNLVRYMITFRERLPQGRSVVNYELLALMTPNLILGSVIGVLANVVFRDWLYMILITIIFSHLSMKTYTKGVDLYRKEREERKKLHQPLLVSSEKQQPCSSCQRGEAGSYIPIEPDTQDLSKLDVSKDKPTEGDRPQNLGSEARTLELESSDPDEIIKRQLEMRSKRLINPEALGVFLLCTLLITVISVLRGPRDRHAANLLSIETCSASWWILSLLFIPIGAFINYFLVRYYNKEHQLKKKYGLTHLDTFELSPKNITKMLLIGILAGFLVALLGISGGVIVGPILIQLNLNPREATYTGSLVGVVSAVNSAIQVVILKPVSWDYAMMVAVSGSIGCLLAMFWIMEWIKRKKADSYVVFAIFVSLILSLFFANFSLASRIIKDYGEQKDVFSLHSLCG